LVKDEPEVCDAAALVCVHGGKGGKASGVRAARTMALSNARSQRSSICDLGAA